MTMISAEVHMAIYDEAREGLRSTTNMDALAEMAGRVVARAESVLEEALDGPQRRATACGPRCPHCCVVNVSVLLPEAAAIARHLRLARREGMLPSLAEFADKVRWMEDSERIWRRTGCPFLDGEGSCSIHTVRPLLCRGITSTDPAACIASLQDSGDEEGQPIVMNLVQKGVMDTAFCALAEAMDACGLDSRSMELSRGVTAVMKRPEMVADFLAGRKIAAEL